ncbi:hypothetical protein EIP91_011590 [Steccherinum ochraceum]|uniref:DUF6697 domain-containing protein n=1 Tax=Steccherinum ochraceum TaxID=92696 RepID=A0A4R0RKI1_9APHY|nr:hypothetical protein EIP91_011590 [Steccherinum ochraceum]
MDTEKRLDAIEKSLNELVNGLGPRLGSMETMLTLLLSRSAAATGDNNSDGPQTTVHRIGPPRPRNALAGPSRLRHRSTVSRVPATPSPQPDASPNVQSQIADSSDPWPKPPTPKLVAGRTNHPIPSGRPTNVDALPFIHKPKTDIASGLEVTGESSIPRIRIPGGNSSSFRAASEGTPFLSPTERRQGHVKRTQFLAARVEPAGAPVGVQSPKREREGSVLPLARKRPKVLPVPFVLLPLPPRPRAATPRNAVAGPSAFRNHSAQPRHHSQHVQSSPVPGDDLQMQTDSESLEEDSSNEEMDTDWDDLFGYSGIPDLTESEVDEGMVMVDQQEPVPEQPPAQSPQQDPPSPSEHRNGSVDYGPVAADLHAYQPPFTPDAENFKDGDNDDVKVPLAPSPVNGRRAAPAVSSGDRRNTGNTGNAGNLLAYDGGGSPVAGPSRLPDLEPRPRRARAPAVKSERFSVPPEGVQERLAGVETLSVHLDVTIRRITVDRPFMSNKFKCSPQAMFSKPTVDGQAVNFVFPNPSMNPELPRDPGKPGLLCRAVSFVQWNDEVFKMIVRLRVNKWLYLGNYRSQQVRSLSQGEFLQLSPAVQNIWVKYVLTMKAAPYAELRAKIALRQQYGREPSDQELKHALDGGDRFFNVSPETVLEAYKSGQRIIHIWKLWCVEYDEAFQRRLAQEFTTWERPLPKKKKLKNPPPAPAPNDRENEENAPPPQPEAGPADPADVTRKSDRLGVKPRRKYKEYGEEDLDFGNGEHQSEVMVEG